MSELVDLLDHPKTGNQVATATEADVELWCRRLGCNAQELHAAIKAVGRHAPKIRAHISRERAGRASGRTLYQSRPWTPPTPMPSS